MIKYRIQLGFKHLNMEARALKGLLQPRLKGMHCRKCQGKETVISFKEVTVTGSLPTAKINFITHQIEACCEEFETRIRAKLGK